MNPKLTSERLGRCAIVYVRQSSLGLVLHHQESQLRQLRQYGLADRARELGSKDIVVIDDDLGRSGSGLVERPGFHHLVGEVCSGEVGAILCIEASRLACNGRDWHHLIDLCGMSGTVVIDPDGVYDPAIVNDRLLLGLKGTMSEFELNLLRERSFEAIWQKARRGELRFCLPVGYLWTAHGEVEGNPDQRVQHALRLVFRSITRSQIAYQPRVRRSLCFWQNASTNHHSGGAGAQDCRTQETTNGMDCLASRSSPWVLFLGAVRTQPSDDRRQRTHEVPHATQGRAWRWLPS